MERNVKFSQPDTRTGKNQPDNRPEGSAAKNRSKSSTLSLHAVAAAREREEEPPLQRRNSIHNVPFVDVHDPDTRTRMERYKEERRSMLRAKYKAEDYLSSSFSRKKKVSTNSQDSCEVDLASSPVSTPPSPDQEDPSPSAPEKTEDPTETQFTKFAQETNVSQKFLKLKQPEQQSFISKAFVPEPKNGIFYKTEVAVASVQKKSSNTLNFNKPQSRPDELTISDPATAERENNKKNLARSDSSDTSPEPAESVNVRERASIFGPRKFTETKVRTVSAPVAARPVPVPVPRASKQLQSQSMTSPSKIRNMAAMFEQSQWAMEYNLF